MMNFTRTLAASVVFLSAPALFAASWESANNGTTYTLQSLSEISESGVSKVSGNVYRVSNDITIMAGDKFVLDGGLELRMAGESLLRINGFSSLGAADARTLITRDSEESTPQGIYIVYEGEEPVVIRNLDFEYASLRNYGSVGFNMSDCSFRYSNGRLSSSGAVTLGSTGANFTITRCVFAENTVPAIGGGANIFCGLEMTDCTLFDNNSSNTNKPQINITVGGNLPVILRNISVIGAGRDKVGGIAVGNMLSGEGDNLVTIDSVTIKECRYGITGVGPMQLTIANCMLYNNNHETNPNAGGSGISLSSVTQREVIIRGCHIENSLWGVTVINSKANLGQVDNPDSPGNNEFVNNGNSVSGSYVPYDLYNNSVNTIYAQNNLWSVPEQTQEEIEKVIFHRNDNPSLGEVIFMPAGNGSVSAVNADGEGLYILDGMVYTNSPKVDIYTISGMRIATLGVNGGSVSLPELPAGIYILRAGANVQRVCLN